MDQKCPKCQCTETESAHIGWNGLTLCAICHEVLNSVFRMKQALEISEKMNQDPPETIKVKARLKDDLPMVGPGPVTLEAPDEN